MKTRYLSLTLPGALLLFVTLHAMRRPAEISSGAPPTALRTESLTISPPLVDNKQPLGAVTTPPSAPGGALWTVQKRLVPESLRAVEPDYRHGQALPLRAARLGTLRPNILDELAVGMTVVLPQVDGSTMQGVIHTAINPREGLRTIAGNLTAPRAGWFHMEMSEAGLRASFAARGAGTVSQIRPSAAGGHLLVEDLRAHTVCVAAPHDAGAGLDDFNGGIIDGGITTPVLNMGGNEWNLESFPGAAGVVYLDFTGHTVTGTQFNTEYNDGQPIVAAAHPEYTPGNAKYRPDWIVRIWDKCREDFAPFNLNVTTRASVFNAANAARRTRVLITPTKAWFTDTEGSSGGVAYKGSFRGGSDTPCWVWNGNINYSCPESISHEVGHALGLNHSSRETLGSGYVEYFGGYGIWAPIMGNSFTDERPFTLWDNGEFPAMLNHEDQVAIIAATGIETNNCGFRADDHAGTLAAATVVTANPMGVIHTSGRIEQNGDKDVFSFTMPPGAFDMVVAPHSPGPNALVKITLKNQAGTTLLSATACEGPDGKNDINAQLKYTAAAGATYYLEVTNAAYAGQMGYPAFSSYATLGNYQVEITEPGGDDVPPLVQLFPVSVVSGAEAVTFFIQISDNRGLDMSTIGPGLCKVQKGGQTWIADFDHTSLLDDWGLKYAGANFRMPAPGGYWDPADAGTYTVIFDGQLVKDLNDLPGTQETRTFIAPATDGQAPKVEISPLDPPVEGAGDYEFTVEFDDWDSAFQMATFGSDDIIVTDAESTPLTVTLKEIKGTNFNRFVVAKWSVAAPGGVWNGENVGIYTVALKAGGIISGGTPLAGKVLGTFQHQIVLFSRNMDANPGFTLNTGWTYGTPTGQGGNGGYSGRDPESGEDGPYVLGTNLNGNYDTGVAAVRYATSPYFSTVGFQDLTLNYERWLNTWDPVMVEYRVGAGPWKTLWSSDFEHESYWVTRKHTLPPECNHQAQVQVRWGIGPTAAAGGDTYPAGGWNLDNIRVLAANNFGPGRIILTPSGRFFVYEDGRTTPSYKVKLDQDPGANPVTVTLTPSKPNMLMLPATLVLNSTNWSTGKTIAVTAVDDYIYKGTNALTVAHKAVSADARFNDLVGPTLSVTVYDNDDAVIATQPADKIAPAGTPVTLTVVPAVPHDAHTYQWYSGLTGQTGRAFNNATSASFTLSTPTGASSIWVRVTRHYPGGGTIVQDSNTAVVAPLTGYAAWKYNLLSHGYTQAQLDAPSFDAGDPEGDGLTHWTEYAFSGQPWVVDGALLPRLEQSTDGLFLRFRRARADVNYTVQISEDAGAWTDLTTNPGGVNPLVDQLVPLPAAGKQRLFARVHLAPK